MRSCQMCVLLSFDGKNEDKYTRKSKVFATRYVFSWDIALPSSACLGESRSLLCVGLRSIYCLLSIRNLLELQGLVMVNVFTCLKHPHLSAPVLCPLGSLGCQQGVPSGTGMWMPCTLKRCAHSVAEEELAS